MYGKNNQGSWRIHRTMQGTGNREGRRAERSDSKKIIRKKVQKMAKRTPPDVEVMIVQLYEEGKSVRNLAAEFGMRASTVEAIVDRNGAVRKKKKASKIMNDVQKVEWDFLTALLRGELKIVRKKKGTG